MTLKDTDFVVVFLVVDDVVFDRRGIAEDQLWMVASTSLDRDFLL